MTRRPRAIYFSQFKFATWSAWRAGQFSSLAPGFLRQAACDYGDFLRELPIFEKFFTAHPPHPGELLINLAKAGEVVGLVLTNQRLWLYSKQTREYTEFNLADIAQLKTSNGWSSGTVTILFRDNTQRKYGGILVRPNDRFITYALERCHNPESLVITSVPAPAPLDAGIEKRQRGPFTTYFLVGVTLGSVMGIFVFDGRLIGQCAILGGLLAYIVWQVKGLADRSK